LSDNDQEEVPLTNWFDSESDFPEISSVNTTPRPGVNVSPLFVNTHHDWALENEDSSTMHSATNKGNSAGNVPLDEIRPHTRGDLLDTPAHTPLQSKSPTIFLTHCVLAMGRRKEMKREGEKKFIIYYNDT